MLNTKIINTRNVNTARCVLKLSRSMFSTSSKANSGHSSEFPQRPNYKDMLCQSKHHFAEMIEEDSPFIFMNQEKFVSNTKKTNKFKLDADMKLNFFRAYSHFMSGLSDYS